MDSDIYHLVTVKDGNSDTAEIINTLSEMAEGRLKCDLRLLNYYDEMPINYRSDVASVGEDNAYQLYKTAAGMTDDPKLQKVLMNFADVELGHRRKIEALYEERVQTERTGSDRRENRRD